MVSKLKSNFFQMIKDLGYFITDNCNYTKKEYPWLLLRLTNDQFIQSNDIFSHRVVLTLDVFSTYSGEKEILEIVDNIAQNLRDFQNKYPEILFIFQKSCKIIDDKETGPVKKHGIISYEFLLGNAVLNEEVNPDATK